MRFRRILKTIFWSQRRIIMWVLFIAIIIVAWGLLQRDPIVEYQKTLKQRNEQRAAVEALEQDILQLETERTTLEEGGFEHAKVARQRYRLSKPGEFVLYLDTPDEPTPPEVNMPIPEPALP